MGLTGTIDHRKTTEINKPKSASSEKEVRFSAFLEELDQRVRQYFFQCLNGRIAEIIAA